MMNRPVLVIGSLNMDLVATAEKLPLRGETVFGSAFATFPGGKGGNQAVAAAKLGAAVTMVSCIGADGFGDHLKESLAQTGVNIAHIRSVSESTGTALITVAAGGANTIVVVSGANNSCGSADVDRALASLPGPGIVVIQHEIPEDTVVYAIHKAKQTGWTVILNPAPARPVKPETLALVDIITPNETEAATLTGRTVGNTDEALQAAKVLLDKGVGAVVVTLGAQGALYVTSDELEQIPAVSVQAVDTTAAGDAYTGALACALAEGQPVRLALRFAAAVAAIAVTRSGAQPAMPWRREVEEFMAKLEVKL